MNILFINISDIKGGAALGSYRLHQDLLAAGFSSKMLVGEAISQSNLVDQVPKTYQDKILRPFTELAGLNYINLISSFTSITQHPFFKEADILNFHCLHHGYFNYLAIPKISKRKPILYKLSDMWSFTGHCAYSFDCEKWKIGCGRCPYPNNYPAIRRDSTALEWKLKKYVYDNSNLSIVVPSKWLKTTAEQSLLSQYEISFIPNGIDLEAYAPIDKGIARKAIGIPDGKKAILFAAQNLQDPRKGSDLLARAFKELPKSLKNELVLVCFGTGGNIAKDLTDLTVIELGYIAGDRLKSIVYSAADVFVFPTRADIFGLVLLESMACGTPMVSFAVGGVPELVRPGITGLLAEPENPADLSAKLTELLEDSALRANLSKNCRRIAVEEYSVELQAQRYIALYKNVIANFNSSK